MVESHSGCHGNHCYCAVFSEKYAFLAKKHFLCLRESLFTARCRLAQTEKLSIARIIITEHSDW